MKSCSNRISREKVILILHWCIKNCGESKFRKSYPKLRVYKSQGKSKYEDREIGLRGTFNPNHNRITIYLGSIFSIRDLCDTMVHEYQHYILDSAEYDIIFHIMKKRGYDNEYIWDHHPHEKFALKMENKLGKLCYNELKYVLSKK